jgi:hypothetical protein
MVVNDLLSLVIDGIGVFHLKQERDKSHTLHYRGLQQEAPFLSSPVTPLPMN